jgi:hypothetical protein
VGSSLPLTACSGANCYLPEACSQARCLLKLLNINYLYRKIDVSSSLSLLGSARAMYQQATRAVGRKRQGSSFGEQLAKAARGR